MGKPGRVPVFLKRDTDLELSPGSLPGGQPAAGTKWEKVSFSNGARRHTVAVAARSARHSPGIRRTSRPESHVRCARADKINGEDVKLISYLPAAVTTLFFLAANLLLGYLQ